MVLKCSAGYKSAPSSLLLPLCTSRDAPLPGHRSSIRQGPQCVAALCVLRLYAALPVFSPGQCAAVLFDAA